MGTCDFRIASILIFSMISTSAKGDFNILALTVGHPGTATKIDVCLEV